MHPTVRSGGDIFRDWSGALDVILDGDDHGGTLSFED